MVPESAPPAASAAHPSTLRLHRLRLGELGPDEAASIHAHLAGCPTCARRHQVQRSIEAEVAARPVPAAIAALAVPPPESLLDRARAWWATAGSARLVLPVLAVAALAAAFVQVAPTAGTGALAVAQGDADGVRTKGVSDGVLQAWVLTGSSARPLYQGEALAAGARVQLKVDAGRRRFVTFAGRDGTGSVEVYGTVPAAGPGLRPAPFALTLDDSAGEQQFFAILTDERPQADALVRSLGNDPVRVNNAEVATVVVAKED